MKSIEETLSLFDNGFNCSQCVFSHFASDLKLDEEITLKIASGFGAGMGRMQKICGAVSGAYMVLGLKYGHFTPNDRDSKQRIYQKVQEFTKNFEKKYSTIICRELLGCDITNDEGLRRAHESGIFEIKCKQIVSDAIEILKRL